ncbi:cyclin-like f-box [Fusarium coicis]|nr:cyclin-like f-box [Fusarium coicis]
MALKLYEPPYEPPYEEPPREASLKTLPPELKEQITRLVDPIGLFSLRLIHNDFRNIIRPQKQQYIEHLLALECRARYGGPSLPFIDLAGRILWIGSALLATRSRWACAGCVRLLPYYHFQNKFLAEVIWRKPMPGSPAANIITSWEPVPAMVATLTPLPADGGRHIQNTFGFVN